MRAEAGTPRSSELLERIDILAGMRERYGAPAEADYIAFQTALGKVREHLRGLRIENQES